MEKILADIKWMIKAQQKKTEEWPWGSGERLALEASINSLNWARRLIEMEVKRCKICGDPLYGLVRIHHHYDEATKQTAD